VPAPVIANREPPPPAVSREQAAAAAQALARAALKPLAPTPDAGEAATNFGAPVAAPADTAPAPVSSESQRPSVGGPAATYDDAATQRKLAGIDDTLAAGSPSNAGSAPADGYLADGTERGSALGGGSSGVVWDGNGAGCGEPLVDPKPDVSGIAGGGVTYNIEVQFRLDGNGLVTGVNIVKSGNSELNSAVLSAARGMRFDCRAEARGRRTYEIKPGGR
jgi:TonB family protein